MRSDTERNRRRLIKAAAHLVARRGSAVRMIDVAERAEVSTATAYRHFGSVDEILAQFRYDVGLRLLEFSQKSESSGLDLLKGVCEYWVKLVVKHGGAMVHTRSDEGYLARLRAGAAYLTVQADALLPAISQASEEMGIDDPGDEALFLWNILFDPREIFDLLRTVGLTEQQAAQRLFSAFCGALREWAADSTAATQVAATA
ncbi:TetR/AcrR family transcriptional regulator [Luethyella okanaganae]|uniref:TetR/AcrR family transcriptional regulator n=1 Tax=Luethyella okanaganae TaxID=69372 RepID=A0ABW1VCD4_9MICO